MKHLFFILFSLCVLHNAEAMPIDSLLIEAYQRNNESVYEIIEHENLEDSLKGTPFCCIYYQNIWSIVVRKEHSFVLYYGFRVTKEETIRKELSADDPIFVKLFSLDRNNIKGQVYKRKDLYNPLYWYFVLTDDQHNNIYEWSEPSLSEDKYAKSCLDIIGNYIGYLFKTSCEDFYGN